MRITLILPQVPPRYAFPGAPLQLAGDVTTGFGRGSRDLGFPTANLPPSPLQEQLQDLPSGVYFGWEPLQQACYLILDLGLPHRQSAVRAAAGAAAAPAKRCFLRVSRVLQVRGHLVLCFHRGWLAARPARRVLSVSTLPLPEAFVFLLSLFHSGRLAAALPAACALGQGLPAFFLLDLCGPADRADPGDSRPLCGSPSFRMTTCSESSPLNLQQLHSESCRGEAPAQCAALLCQKKPKKPFKKRQKSRKKKKKGCACPGGRSCAAAAAAAAARPPTSWCTPWS